jgi:hypothetical protein
MRGFAVALDLPDRQRIESRRVRRLTRPHVETGMMPRAADGLAVDEAFGERPMVVAAMGIDRKDVRARTHQKHVLIADMAQQCCAGEIA